MATKRRRTEDEGRGEDKGRMRIETVNPVDIIIKALHNNLPLQDKDVSSINTIADVSAIYSRLRGGKKSPLYGKVKFLQLIKAMIKDKPEGIIEFSILMCRMRDGANHDPRTNEFYKDIQPVFKAIVYLRRFPSKCKTHTASAARAHIGRMTRKFIG